MMDFSRPAGESLNKDIAEAIDAALEAENNAQVPRNYLGASRFGVECLRALGYEWADIQAGVRPEFEGKTIRRFLLGHMQEDETARWLKAAGFELYTHKPDGGQFGFVTARDPETGVPRAKGHLDGCITGGPVALPYPVLWEHKIMKAELWRKYADKGVKAAYPIYYAQVQTYMAYMDLTHCLFTGWNSDTSELWCELIPLDPGAAQASTDRAVVVLSAGSPEELPRIARDPTDFRCKFCNHKDRCWAEREMAVAPVGKPNWLKAMA